MSRSLRPQRPPILLTRTDLDAITRYNATPEGQENLQRLARRERGVEVDDPTAPGGVRSRPRRGTDEPCA